MKKSLADIQMIFLVSRGRSGSTLLQSILDAHPNICAPIESKFVLHLRSRYQKISNWNEKVIEQFIKDIYTNRKFRLFWKVSAEELRTKFNEYEINHFQDACKVVYLCHHSFFDKKDIQIIVDKNPLHSRFSDYLLDVFPEARFIHLIRDPRAVTYSHIKSLKQKNAANLAFDWRLLNECIEKVKILHPTLFHTIKYEDFTSQPKEEGQRLFDFIGLLFQPEMLDASNTLKNNYQSSTYLSLPQHKSITSPINPSKNEAWKKNLTVKQINLINSCCKNLLITYQYEFTTPTENFLTSLILFKSKLKSKFIHNILKILFHLPFSVRVLLYNAVSMVKDKQYKD